MARKTLDPLCIKCKRVMRKGDKRVYEGEHQVHARGFCRGPHVKHWFVVAYNGEVPISFGRLPDTVQELETWVDEYHLYEITLKKLNLNQVSKILNKMGNGP